MGLMKRGRLLEYISKRPTQNMSESSELSELNSGDFNDISSQSNDGNASSNSSNLIFAWPETQTKTYKIVKDAEVELKKFGLLKHDLDLESSILESDIELQSQIREINSEISDITIEITDQEIELSRVKEQRNEEILAIRTRLSNTLKKYEREMYETQQLADQLQVAIEEQEKAHAFRLQALHNEMEARKADLDIEIDGLAQDIDAVKNMIYDSAQKYENDIIEINSTNDALESEIRTFAGSTRINDQGFEQINKQITSLKRELIIAEETSDSLREQIDKAYQVRNQMKHVLSRSNKKIWDSRASTLLLPPE